MMEQTDRVGVLIETDTQIFAYQKRDTSHWKSIRRNFHFLRKLSHSYQKLHKCFANCYTKCLKDVVLKAKTVFLLVFLTVEFSTDSAENTECSQIELISPRSERHEQSLTPSEVVSKSKTRGCAFIHNHAYTFNRLGGTF